MKVVFIDHYPNRIIGGGEEYFLCVAEGIKKAGIEVGIVCLPGSGLADQARKRNIEVAEINFFSKNPFKDASNLNLYLEKLKPDVINTHGFYSSLVGRFAARKSRIKRIICTVHTEVKPEYFAKPAQKLNFFIRNLIEKFTSRGIEYIAVSETIKEQLIQIGIDPSRIYVAYPGLSDEFIGKISEKDYSNISSKKEIVIGSCGRLEKVKDYETLLRAVRRIIDDGFSIRAVIYGEGSQKENLIKLAYELGISDYVQFPGYERDEHRIYKSMDIFVSTSLSESFNLSLLKASAYGLACVSTLAGGQIEIIEDGMNGLLFTPGNYKELAERIEFLIMNPKKLANFGKQAREKVIGKFTEKNLIETYLKVLRKDY